MNELIKVNYDGERPTVSGRELHEFLEVGTEYMKWFERMCGYGFTEGVDFSSFLTESTGGRPATDHQLTISMAKELCMLQRTEKGSQARKYFIAVEEAWNNPDMVIERAQKILTARVQKLEVENSRLLIELDESKEWYTIKRIAKINGISWRDIRVCSIIGNVTKAEQFFRPARRNFAGIIALFQEILTQQGGKSARFGHVANYRTRPSSAYEYWSITGNRCVPLL